MICQCVVCGSTFEGKRSNACICSYECKLVRQREWQKNYVLNNPEKSKESKRNWWNENRGKNVEGKT